VVEPTEEEGGVGGVDDEVTNGLMVEDWMGIKAVMVVGDERDRIAHSAQEDTRMLLS